MVDRIRIKHEVDPQDVPVLLDQGELAVNTQFVPVPRMWVGNHLGNAVELAGLNGADGVDGAQGIDGEDGAKGDQGDQGIQGIDGPQGIQGETGDQGVPGNDGAKGDTGEQGIQGETGDQGIQGIQGEVGPEGPEGPSTPSSNSANILTLGTDDLLFLSQNQTFDPKAHEHVMSDVTDAGSMALENDAPTDGQAYSRQQIDGDMAWTPESAASLITGRKNLVVNGGYQIAQTPVFEGNGYGGPDMLYSERASQEYSHGAISGYGQVVRIRRTDGAATVHYLRHIIEVTANSYLQAGMVFTLSFQIQADVLAESLRAALWWAEDGAGTGGVLATDIVNLEAPPVSTNTMHFRQVTFTLNSAPPADARCIYIRLELEKPSGYGATDYTRITQVQLEQGDKFTGYEAIPISLQRSMCEYYYIYPARNAGTGYATGANQTAVCYGTTSFAMMRSIPAVAVSSIAGTNNGTVSIQSQYRAAIVMYAVSSGSGRVSHTCILTLDARI